MVMPGPTCAVEAGESRTMADRNAEAEPVEIEDIGSNPDPRRPIGRLIEERLSRRAALRGLAGGGAALGFSQWLRSSAAYAQAHSSGNTPESGPSSLRFPELRHQAAEGDA